MVDMEPAQQGQAVGVRPYKNTTIRAGLEHSIKRITVQSVK